MAMREHFFRRFHLLMNLDGEKSQPFRQKIRDGRIMYERFDVSFFLSFFFLFIGISKYEQTDFGGEEVDVL